MLWLKAWLETRSRVAFVLVWGSSFLLPYIWLNGRGSAQPEKELIGLLSAAGFVWLFTPLYLSGSGIRTQLPFGRPARGLVGSTQYTLSLPVSRARLLLTRTALGMTETIALVLIFCFVLWFFIPVPRATRSDWLAYAVTIITCGSGVYGAALVATTLVDDAWIISLGTVAVVMFWALQFVGVIPAWANIFQPLAVSSPLVTHSLPWAPMFVSLGICAAGVWIALQVVNRQEY